METPLFRVPSEKERLTLARLIARGILARRGEDASDDAMQREIALMLPYICVMPRGERRAHARGGVKPGVDPQPRPDPAQES